MGREKMIGSVELDDSYGRGYDTGSDVFETDYQGFSGQGLAAYAPGCGGKPGQTCHTKRIEYF
jgi:hypothetical protein